METTATAIKTKWAIDPMHSEVVFKVKHLMISTVTGSFKNFSGALTTKSEDFENSEVQFTLDVNSIFTNQEMRDNHLRSAEFFDVSKHPTIDFLSTSFKKIKEGDFLLTGNLTIKGITKEVQVKAEFGGSAKDSQGNLKAGFEVTGAIKRKDFGLTANPLTETGGLVLGEEVKLIANIQIARDKNS